MAAKSTHDQPGMAEPEGSAGQIVIRMVQDVIRDVRIVEDFRVEGSLHVAFSFRCAKRRTGLITPYPTYYFDGRIVSAGTCSLTTILESAARSTGLTVF